MTKTEEATRADMEQSWLAAKVNETAAFEELDAHARQIRRIERDLADNQKWLRAFRGEDDALRNKLLASAEWDTFDPAATEKEVLRLLGDLRRKNAEWKAASEKLEDTKRAEDHAFRELKRFNHREAVVEVLQYEVKMYRPLRAEMQERDEMAERDGVRVGSLPVLARQDFGQFDIKDPQSGVCHRIREAIGLGYLTGNEDWLAGVAFKETGATVETLVRRPY